MKNNILVSVEETDFPCPIEDITDFISLILTKRQHSAWEISVLFCSDNLMQQYNQMYRHIDSSTDVLSFESGGTYVDDDGNEWYTAGDIAICPAAMWRNTKNFAVSGNEELKRLLIHGILHLEGMDHGDAHVTADAHITADTTGVDTVDEMLEIQEKLLQEISNYQLIKENI